MTDGDMPAAKESAAKTMTAQPDSRRRRIKQVQLVAIVVGSIGLFLAILSPFLPVKYSNTQLNWPQSGTVENVVAPNVAYAPLKLDLTVPCVLASSLPKTGGVLVSTVPSAGVEASKVGLFVRATADSLQVTQRNTLLLSTPRADAQANPNCRIVVHSDTTGTSGRIDGVSSSGANPLNFTIADPDSRPQIIGVYTDLPKSVSAEGLSFSSTIDMRFSTSPTALKSLLLVLGVIMTVVSIAALGILDARDGRKLRRLVPKRWWRPKFVDVTVVGILGVWLFIGGNTADDGYQVTVGRVAGDAGYLVNYYRYFGAPQDPFGWHYRYLSLWMEVSTATPWLRLLPFMFAVAGWFLISRAAVPRLGAALRSSSVVMWAAALAFLAVWLPFNNGLRIEPFLTVGTLLTWVLVERAIASGRFLPLALAIICAAGTLTVHPAGAIAILPLITGLRPLMRHLLIRRRRDGLAALLMPILASGTVVLFAIFADQTLATILEGIKVQGIVGPTNKWWNEGMRYYILLNPTPDGSIARRVGVFVTFLSSLIVVLILLQRRRVAGVVAAPLWRLVGVMAGAVVVLAFVPTKATHQMGAFACLTGVLAAAATAFIRPEVMVRRCNRTFIAAACAYALAIAFAGRNQWWYVGSYGIPWADDTPAIKGIPLYAGILVIALLLTALGAWQYFRDDRSADAENSGQPIAAELTWWQRLPTKSIAIVCAAALAFTFVSFAKSIYTQRDSWSWANSNVDAMRGKNCALADAVLVEKDANAGVLTAARVAGQNPTSAEQALLGSGATGFEPNALSPTLDTDDSDEESSDNSALVDPTATGTDQTADTPGREVAKPTIKRPFGLSADVAPVVGSFGVGNGQSRLTSDWYQLPAASPDAPLITLAAAGDVEYVDELAVTHAGQKVRLQFGRVEPDGRVTPVGMVTPLGINHTAPKWQNLRFPRADAPPRATVMRVVAEDTATDYDKWVALTPPRVSKMVTLNSLVGDIDPVLLDWEVALAFPCQRPAAIVNGVWEVPKWRIEPDAEGERVNSQRWMAGDYGGPLGVVENSLRPTVLPSYLRNDWAKDWGNLVQLVPLVPQTVAQLDVTDEARSGWWTPGPMRAVTN
ncbi:putative arabinosyltransferase [Gordonia effusa NBRC 100432]|uniref:Putative arabinosyltransferase n=1 Tax=Gordonia effusa NBRC 100432 TaxID=1077974 RepID=H0R584_9ACTN|nr:putative arabinosyltransferase [Gordonia effusa NBRC 100432]